jgi:hypothetical protein
MPPMPRIAPRSLRDAAVEIWIQVKESGFNSVPQMTWSWLDLTSVGGQRWNHHEIIMTMNSWSYWIWIYLNRFHSWLWGILFLLFDPKKWPMLGMFGSQHFWHVLHFDKNQVKLEAQTNVCRFSTYVSGLAQLRDMRSHRSQLTGASWAELDQKPACTAYTEKKKWLSHTFAYFSLHLHNKLIHLADSMLMQFSGCWGASIQQSLALGVLATRHSQTQYFCSCLLQIWTWFCTFLHHST